MRLSDALSATLRRTGLEVFTSSRSLIDPRWIEAALATVHGIAVRRRKLPADVVVWTVLGAAIFSRWSFDEVVRAFGLTPPTRRGNKRSAPKSSSVAEARERLGSEVIRHVFALATSSWLALREMMGPEWHGLRVFAADGSAFCTPDTAANREQFKLPASDKDKPQAAYPQVKVLALMDVHSHVVVDAEVGDCRTGDITLFEAMISRVPDHSLTILDRGFRSWGMLHRLGRGGTQRHWLLRVHRTLKAKLVTTLGPGDRIVEIETSSKARELDPLLPKRMRVREIAYAIGPNVYKLITSLLDPILFPAEELVRQYHARWEIEIAFDDIKTEQRGGNDVLRSRKPDGIRQEIWGLLLAHNLVRVEMSRAAFLAGVPPTRISFHGALRLVGHHLQTIPASAAPSKLAEYERFLRETISFLILPPRRTKRTFPRAVKRVSSKYPKKKRLQPRIGA